MMSRALDLVTLKRAAFMGQDDLALQPAAYEALAGMVEARYGSRASARHFPSRRRR